MLSSALIGCFNAAHFSRSQEGNTGKIYISILSLAVISLGNYTVNKMRPSGNKEETMVFEDHGMSFTELLFNYAKVKTVSILWHL